MNIEWNGSRFAGEPPDTVDSLIALLEGPGILNPSLGAIDYYGGKTVVRGNFLNVSHGFRISGSPDEPEFARLVKAVEQGLKAAEGPAAAARTGIEAQAELNQMCQSVDHLTIGNHRSWRGLKIWLDEKCKGWEEQGGHLIYNC